MKKFEAIIAKYAAKGVSEDNIEYAISAVKDGSKREHTLESLTSDYRGMDRTVANNMLEEMYSVNGGEFKKENRNGYLFGTFLLMMGGGLAYYIWSVFQYGSSLDRPFFTIAAAFVTLIGGLYLIIMSLLGKYRDDMEPFEKD
jgi:hypothetical protein